MEARVVKVETKIERLEADMQELVKEVRELNQSLARYRGAWGAVVMIGAAVTTAVGLAVKFFHS